MEEVLAFATVLTPVIVALVELVKKTFFPKKNYIPLIALLLGVFIGVASYPFTDFDLTVRIWAGGISGLASTGLFESLKKHKSTIEGDGYNG